MTTTKALLKCSKCGDRIASGTELVLNGVPEHRVCPYNGWTNYQTWVVNLWNTNDQSSAGFWEEIAQEVWDEPFKPFYPEQSMERSFVYRLGERMKEFYQENTPVADGVYADLLGSALDDVNWYEIAEHYLETVQREAAE